MPPSHGKGFFRGMLGPRPSAKKVFQLLPPGFRCFSPLSPFLLGFAGDKGGSLRIWGLQAGPVLPQHPTHLSTGEAGALGVVGSVGVPSRPWVRAWASSSVSRRVEGPLPARDLGLGRRQRPKELGKGAAVSSGGLSRPQAKPSATAQAPAPQRAHPGWQGRGPGQIRREWVGSRQVRRRSEAGRADEEAAPGSQRGQRLWLQLPRARGPSDVLNPDWAGVRGRAGSLGGAGAGSSLGTSHLLPGGPKAPRAPGSYKG